NFNKGITVFTDSSTYLPGFPSVPVASSGLVEKERFFSKFSGGYEFWTGTVSNNLIRYDSSNGLWTRYSDKNKKDNFKKLDTERMLNDLVKMRITKWNYKESRDAKNMDGTIMAHIGPFAEEFYDLAHAGKTRDRLSVGDLVGVSIGLLQGIYKRSAEIELILKEQQTVFGKLKSMLAKLKLKVIALKDKLLKRDERVASIKRRIANIEIENNLKLARICKVDTSFKLCK
ncbi:MAG: hypothetical protein ACI9QD_000979, partial [Thermoproteota archaeon]